MAHLSRYDYEPKGTKIKAYRQKSDRQKELNNVYLFSFFQPAFYGFYIADNHH